MKNNYYRIINSKIRSEVFINSFFSFIGLFVFQITNAVAIILIARKIDLVQYAQFVSISAFLNLTIVFANYGLDNWFLSSIKQNSETIEVWKNTFSKKKRNLILWIVFSFLIGMIFLNQDEYPLTLLLPLLISFYFDNLTQTIFTLFRVIRNYDVIFIVQVIFSIIFFIIVLFLPESEESIFYFLILKIVISSLVFLTSYLLLKKRIITNTKLVKKSSINTKSFLLADIAAKIYSRIDLFLLSLIIGNSATSVYGPALNIITFSFLLPNAFNYVILPKLVNTHNNPKIDNSTLLFKKISLLQFSFQILIGIFLFLLFYYFSGWIISSTFGERYVGSGTLIKYLSLIPFFKSLNFGLGSIITASGNQKRRTVYMGIVASINLFLNLILIPSIGIIGAVISYLISEFLLVLLYISILAKVKY